MKRKTLNLSDDLANWYEEKAKTMGTSTSAVMVMGMSAYKDQQEAIKAAHTMEKMFAIMQTEQYKQYEKENPDPLPDEEKNSK